MKETKVYKAREGAPFRKDDVDEIGQFIYGIKERTTENVLNEIKKHSNEIIHFYIEWNDKKASHEYRLQQIRNIINHIEIEIVFHGETKPIRAFHSIKQEEGGKPIYVDVVTTFSDDYSRNKVIERAETELRNWRDRYSTYKELKPILEKITIFLGE